MSVIIFCLEGAKSQEVKMANAREAARPGTLHHHHQRVESRSSRKNDECNYIVEPKPVFPSAGIRGKLTVAQTFNGTARPTAPKGPRSV